MQSNTVSVDHTSSPPSIHYASSFNVAVPFIDRHLDEGRADEIAIRTVDGQVTYAQLAERVESLLGA